MGTRGVCPMEMLNAIHLGVSKHARGMFFEHVGSESKTAQEIDASDVLHGESPIANSQTRNVQFASGLVNAPLRRSRAFFLCLFAAVGSDKGQSVLAQRPKWREFGVIKDSNALLETLSEWKTQ